MAKDTGVYSTGELRRTGMRTSGIKRAAKAGQLIDCGRGWWQTRDANPLVAKIVLAGGAMSCLSTVKFHKDSDYPNLYLPDDPVLPHGRLSRHGKSVVDADDIKWCQGHGPARPLEGALDSFGMAMACAVRCLPAEEWIAVCDSILRYTPLTKDDLREQMGYVSKPSTNFSTNVTAAQCQVLNQRFEYGCVPWDLMFGYSHRSAGPNMQTFGLER